MKKSYNPFKMWGSWIGMFIGIPLGLYIKSLMAMESVFLSYLRNNFNCIMIYNPLYVTTEYKPFLPCGLLNSLIFYIIIGFFIGWGIHSLIRRLRK